MARRDLGRAAAGQFGRRLLSPPTGRPPNTAPMARILVLDNDRAMRELLCEALRRGGHQALPAGRADEAESLLAEEPVDGMLLDLNLGGGHTGASLVERWSAASRLAPFLIVTGTPEHPELDALGRIDSFRGVVAKPFDLGDLLTRVGELAS